MSAIILVLVELNAFREFIITKPDASNERNHITFLVRKVFKKILAKKMSHI